MIRERKIKCAVIQLSPLCEFDSFEEAAKFVWAKKRESGGDFKIQLMEADDD